MLWHKNVIGGKKKGKDDKPASSQPLVKGRWPWSHNSPQRHKNKTLIVPSHHVEIWKPRYRGGYCRKSSVRWWDGAFVGRQVCGSQLRVCARLGVCAVPPSLPPELQPICNYSPGVPLIKQRLAHYSHNHLENVLLRLVLCCIKAPFLYLSLCAPPLPCLPLWRDQGWFAL